MIYTQELIFIIPQGKSISIYIYIYYYSNKFLFRKFGSLYGSINGTP